MSYKYKAKNGLDFFVPGVGHSTDGILETDTELNEAPSLELVQDSQPVQAAQVAAPNAVIGVAPQATQAPEQPTQPIQGASN